MLRTCRAICISDEEHEPGFISSPTHERLSLPHSLTEGDAEVGETLADLI